VNALGEHVFAHPRFAEQKHVDAARGDAFEQLVKVPHARVGHDDVARGRRARGLALGRRFVER
jgi:hypothetical protein